MRADVFLVEQGYARTRSEARAAIEAGGVISNGVPVRKASQMLTPDCRIAYERAHPFVSRGGLKLSAALDHYKLSPERLVCLDLGASTGGFSEVLLLRGAKRVFAVDVGHGQLDAKIAADERVTILERTNVRDLDHRVITQEPAAIVADLSFISLKTALPAALDLAVRGAWLIALVKPQFEVGPARVGKGGIVRDEAVQRQALDETTAWLEALPEWSVIGSIESPIAGGDGNREFLIAARKS
jgi:23S rRNA (cytidine1920-2'-O)/16S rRNA (cytidine1409-2'-O)-methyltransferase